MEKHTVYEYLQDIREGGLTKRWQAAFELSRILSNKDTVIKEQKFVDAMIEAFEKSKGDDERVRQYLALAMARTGNKQFVDILLKNIEEEKNENLCAIISSLGILGDSKAVDVLLKYLSDDNVRIRLATVIALGNMDDPKTLEPLKTMLNDTQVNVTWDAAIALAKKNDRTSKGLILKLLDRNYLANYPEVDAQEQTKIILITLQAVQNWHDPDIEKIMKQLFESDKNMNVRNLAHKMMDLKK